MKTKTVLTAYQSATAALAALADRQVSAVELLEQTVARIEARDTRTNAVVVRDFEHARAAAKAADDALARGERRPLLGLPMTVKESFYMAGLPCSWGVPLLKDWRPTEDAVAVQRLKAAGAVILGKTNVPYALGDWQSFNEIYGTTNNPWDLGRTPGGSSGGAAASVAAGYVSLELGSDLAGSLRAPAHYCGIFAHKSSYGLLPMRGHTFPNTVALTDLTVIGPLARTATDLALALDVLAGPDEPDAAAYRLALPPSRHDRLQDFRVLVIGTHPLLPTARAVQAALDALATQLGKAGAKVARNSPLLPDLAEATRIYLRLLMPVISARQPFESYRQAEKAVAALSPEDSSRDALLLRSSVISHHDWLAANEARGQLRRRWRELFRDWDVVLCPAMPTPAFPHDHVPDQNVRHFEIDGRATPYFDQVAWSALATAPGLPATVAPISRSETGLPIGAQIIGPYLEDRTTIAFAGAIERAFGGFVPPPDFPQ